ncbi:CysZ protein [Entomortierella parvispora]|uniref:CysZ protein n=1 Tax=Entomortierella parvispora TaxID=205924 RepID=A0A9P3HB72_9FUNG|nr:CysZ protein [Entomortierella parvispora]
MAVILPSSYPVQGIVYLIAHPQLLTSLICPILLTLVWGLAAFIFGFAFLLKLQAHALIVAKCPAAVAWIVAIIFVLLEIAVMVILFYLIVLPIYQDALFDRVLKLRGLRHVLKKNEGNDMRKCLRGVNGGLVVVFFQIVVMLLTFPVNVVPVLGQIVYVFLNGWIFTFAVRFHYDVEIRYISVLQSREEAWARRQEYTSFGSVAFALEMIPLANLFFMWTNIVGAALWVADEIEKEESRLQNLSSSQSLMGNGDNSASHIVRPEPPRITPQSQQHPSQQPTLQQQHSQHSQQHDAPPTYTPGNHFTVVPMDGVPQQQQHHQYPPQSSVQHQQSFGHPGQSSSNVFAQHGSPRIQPKNKKHPEI